MKKFKEFIYKIEWSAVLTVIGIVALFSTSIIVVVIAPNYLDSSWVSPSSPYQKQMYEISDPNLYISSNTSMPGSGLQFVQHIKKGFTLLAFEESETYRFVAPEKLQKYITKFGDKELKLTSQLILLREPKNTPNGFQALDESKKLLKSLQKEGESKKEVIILELFQEKGEEAFSIASSEGILENWVDQNFKILDETNEPYHKDIGVIYVQNPLEYKIKKYKFGPEEGWRYDPKGQKISNIDELKSHELKFYSRKDLIYAGEKIYAIEGCWYCHSDQTRTLIQDVVLNGNEDFPAPPSSANEYIYQEITFPATRRIGPDLSRVGIKRPSRDWHKSHFWSPKTASRGSIMPSFQHFFDEDPRGTSSTQMGIPNYKFEAIYQYMMTKGTRITPPTQAWWLGKDPVNTKEIIEGIRVLK